MRQLIFRAWDGNKITNDFSLWSDGTIASRISGFTNVKPLEIMQFTGLLDRNGVEIYEGDTLRQVSYSPDNLYESTGQVFFRMAEFMVSREDGSFGHINNKDSNVIGNIYQNPELIKES